MPALTPELLVRDIARSLAFWCDGCGFEVRHERPEEGFALLGLHDAEVMLDQIGRTRDWITAPLQAPLGRGVNLQIEVPDVRPVLDRLRGRATPLFLEPEVKRYRTRAGDVEVRQFLVCDPDGYLLRFQSPAPAAART